MRSVPMNACIHCRAFTQTVHTLHAHHRRRLIQPGTAYRTYQYDISKFDVSKVPKTEAMRAGGSAWLPCRKCSPTIRLPVIIAVAAVDPF